MSNDITTSQILGFKEGIRLLQQQMDGPRLRPGVINETQTGKRQKFDQIGAIELVDKTTRHADVPVVEHDHQGRWVTTKTKWGRDFFDSSDAIRILNNPIGSYSRSWMMGANRSIDRAIINAAFATAVVGEDGDGTETAAFDTAGFQIAVGGTGMTVAKLRQAKRLLDEQENVGPYYVALSARQVEDLLGETEVISSDFNNTQALVRGEMEGTFLGFRYIRSELLGTSGGDRRCIAWSQPSLLVSLGQEPNGFVDWLPEKQAWQIGVSVDVGATRMDEKGVVEIICDEP